MAKRFINRKKSWSESSPYRAAVFEQLKPPFFKGNKAEIFALCLGSGVTVLLVDTIRWLWQPPPPGDVRLFRPSEDITLYGCRGRTLWHYPACRPWKERRQKCCRERSARPGVFHHHKPDGTRWKDEQDLLAGFQVAEDRLEPARAIDTVKLSL